MDKESTLIVASTGTLILTTNSAVTFGGGIILSSSEMTIAGQVLLTGNCPAKCLRVKVEGCSYPTAL